VARTAKVSRGFPDLMTGMQKSFERGVSTPYDGAGVPGLVKSRYASTITEVCLR
jgi:hypothetical protein